MEIVNRKVCRQTKKRKNCRHNFFVFGFVGVHPPQKGKSISRLIFYGGIILIIFCFNVLMFSCFNEANAYTPPLGPPPTDNVPKPINVSDENQSKLGSLGIGTTAPPDTTLDVKGNIQASVYYDKEDINYYLDPFGTMPYSLYANKGAIFLTGNVGIGVTNPGTPLSLANNAWISAQNSAGTGYVNMFKLNASNEIEVGSVLNIGTIGLAENSGAVTLVNLPVSSSATAGTEQSYSFAIDAEPIAKVYAESDGTGGVQNKSFKVIGDADVSGTLSVGSISGSYTGTLSAGNVTPGYFASNAAPGNYTFTNADKVTPILHIDAANNRVGIGTTAPDSKLSVLGTATQLKLVYDASNYQTFTVQSDGDLHLARNGAAATLALTDVGVGIGTTSPGANLHIYNATNHSRIFIDSVAAKDSGLELQEGGSRKWLIYNLESGTGASELNIRNGLSQDLVTIQQSGNVGIGTTSPIKKLSVSSIDANNAEIGVLATGTGEARIFFDAANGDISGSDYSVVGQHNDGNFFISHYGTDRLTIDSSGNVGIGTSSPDGNLDVVGVDGTQASIYNSMYYTGTAGPFVMLQHARGTQASPTIVSSGDATGGIRFRGYNGTEFLYTAVIQSEVDGTPGSADMPGRLVFKTTPDGSSTLQERMRIDAPGNVGIGTTAPDSKLSVRGAATSPQLKLSVDDSNYDTFTVQSDGDLHLARNGAAATLALTDVGVGIGTTSPAGQLDITNPTGAGSDTIGTGTINLGISNDDFWAFRQSATALSDLTFDRKYSGTWYEAMRIQRSSGNVGIGTTSPGAKLEVAGAIMSSAIQPYFILNDTTAGEEDAYLVQNGHDFYINFDTPSSTGAKFLIEGNTGNVGIGTANPSEKLHIAGDVLLDAEASNQARRIFFSENALGNYGGFLQFEGVTDNAFNIGTRTNGSDIKAISIARDTGNVGIGTTTPTTARLVVEPITGATSIDAKTGKIINVHEPESASDAATKGYVDSAYAPGGTEGNVGSTGGTDNRVAKWTDTFIIGNSGISDSSDAVAVTIDLSENVGIGTTSPVAKLDVKDGNVVFSDSDVDHGMTNILPTTSFGKINPLSATAGGLQMSGASDTDATAIYISGTIGTSDPTDTTPAIIFSGAKANGINGQSLGVSETAFQFRNYVTPLMTILAGGNVGIGTTAPAYKLDVRGEIAAGASGATNQIHYVAEPTALTDAATKGYVDSAFIVGDSDWAGVGGYPTLAGEIYHTGNVGIGVTDPTTLLDVEGEGKFNSINMDGNIDLDGYNVSDSNALATDYITDRDRGDEAMAMADEYLRINQSNAFSSGIYTGTSDIRMNTGDLHIGSNGGQGAIQLYANNYGTNYIRINGTVDADSYFNTGGKFGIGTTAPAYKLDVYTPNTASAYVRTLAQDTTKSAGYVYSSATTDKWYNYVNSGSNGELFWDNGTSQVMALTQGGNLNVVGDVTATTFYGNLSGYATSAGAADHATYANSALRAQYLGDSFQVMADAQGKVGIGTTGPGAKLDVRHNGAMGLTIARFYGSGNERFNIIQDAENDWRIYSYDEVDSVFRDLSLGNDAITVKSAGNVGIGTTAPDSKLSVLGTATQLKLAYDASNYDTFTVQSDGDLHLARNGAAATLALTDVGVGIGTTAPASKLAIYSGDDKDTGPIVNLGGNAVNQVESGRLRFTETNMGVSPWYQGAFIHYNGNTNTFNLGVHETADALTASDVNAISILRSNGNVGIGTTSPTHKLEVGDCESTSLDGTLGIKTDSNHQAIRIEEYSGDESWRLGINANGDLVFDDSAAGQTKVTFQDGGNVGIGTTSPTSNKLVINGGGITFEGGGSHYIIGLTPLGAGDPDDYAVNKAYVDALVEGTGGTGLWLANGDDIYNSNSGKIGIGLSNPGAKLHIAGGTDVVLATANTGYIITGATNSTNIAMDDNEIMARNNGVASTLYLQTEGGNLDIQNGKVVVENSTGNVGIGTTSPTNKLIVNSADPIISWFRSNNSGFSRIFIDHFGSGDAQATFAVDGSSRWSIGNDATDSSFKIMPSGNKAFDSTASMTILSSGNVGIGTTAPAYKLDVYTPNTASAYVRTLAQDTTKSAGYVYSSATTDKWYNYVNSGSNGELFWDNGTNKVMTLTQAGYLGIGPNYTSPTGLLDVNNKFIVTDEQITMNVPLNLATAGDISIASDLQFTNPTASAIKSYAPLLIEAGDPSQNVDLTLRGSNTGEVVVDDILRVTSNAYLSSATLSGNVDMQYNDLNNVDKLTVNTIDPVHLIDGKEYATYASFYAGGQKMETSGIVNLQAIYEATYEARPRSPRSTSLEKGEPSILKGSTLYMYKIDFSKLEAGSDLWLFWQTIHQDLSKVVVLLTPSFNGRVWYEKTSSQVRPVKKLGAQSSIIIYSDQPGEVSYRLTAPRQDYDQWPNLISGT